MNILRSESFPKNAALTLAGAVVGYLASDSLQGAVAGAITAFSTAEHYGAPTIKTTVIATTLFSCAYFATEQFIPKDLSLLVGIISAGLYGKDGAIIYASCAAWATQYVSPESLAIISGINLIGVYSKHATVYKTKITTSLIAAICQVFFFTHYIQQGNFKETAVFALYSLPSLFSYYDVIMNWHSERESSSTNDSQSQNTTRSSSTYSQQVNDSIDKRVENLEESKKLEHYHCPILQGLTRVPVLDPTDLHTVYDKKSILEALKVLPQSPITKKPLSADELIPLPAAKEFITDQLNYPNDPPSKELQEAAEQEYNQWIELSKNIVAINRQFKDIIEKKRATSKPLKRIVSSLLELPGPPEKTESRQQGTTNRNETIDPADSFSIFSPFFRGTRNARERRNSADSLNSFFENFFSFASY